MEIVDTHDLPTTFGGRARHNVVNAMHAAATAYVLGVAKDAIAAGLRALAPDADSAPGRLNLYRAGGTDFLVDYAHNPAGLAQLVAFCNQMDVSGRRIIAMSLPADRGDRFVIDGVAEIAGHFDLYVCKNYRIRYGREPHEVPRLLQVGLERAGVAAARIVRIEDEDEAIAHALEISRPGDLIVLVVGKGFRDLGRQVQRFARERAGDRTRPA
jgi:cyanophycin synthetase